MEIPTITIPTPVAIKNFIGDNKDVRLVSIKVRNFSTATYISKFLFGIFPVYGGKLMQIYSTSKVSTDGSP